MKVILKQDVASLGGAGDVVDVADGYGNNFLLPRGLAMRASKGALADADAMQKARMKREARTVEEAEKLKEALEGKVVQIPAKAGEDGTLYGSVGNTVIAEAIQAATGVTVDRRRIPMDKPLKQLGTHEVELRVHPDIVATIQVELVRGD